MTFDELLVALRAREGPPTSQQWEKLRELWEERRRSSEARPESGPGYFFAPPKPPPAWELLEAEFAPVAAGPVKAEPRRRRSKKRPGPAPREIPRAAYNKASDLLGQGVSLEKTAAAAGLSVRQVRKIQAVRVRTGYVVEPGRMPNTVVLREP